MPHVILEGSGDLTHSVEHWTPRTWNEVQQGVEVSITLLRIYREVTDDSWLLELVVKEGKLCQQVGVTIVPRSGGQILLKLSPVGFPRPTWGVQRAVWHVASLLQESEHPWRIIWMSMATSDEWTGETVTSRRGKRRSRDDSTTI